MGIGTIERCLSARKKMSDICEALETFLRREGFTEYMRTGGTGRLDLYMVRDAPLVFGEVEAIRITLEQRPDGIWIRFQVAVYGRDLVRECDEGMVILENQVGQVMHLAYYSGIPHLGSLNAYNLEKKMIEILESL